MPVIFLIRHGENDYTLRGRLAGRLPDVHLNAQGREQAAQLTRSLSDIRINAIYSSPLERSVETAEPIARALGLEVQIQPGLLESDVGKMQGKSIKQLQRQKVWKTIVHTPSRVRFPNGETFLEIQTRLINAVESICAAHKPKDILALVSHADPIKLIVAHYIGLPLDNFQKLEIGTGSLTILALGQMGTSLLGLNLKPPIEFQTFYRKSRADQVHPKR